MARHPSFWPYFALSAICFFWGTTYLAIRMSLEAFPPLVLVSTRFLLSGSILLSFAAARGLYIPRGRELVSNSISGLLLLGVGNTCLVFTELIIPSGMAGLITTISPFWLVGVEALMPGGERLHPPIIGGMLIGLCGAALLATNDIGNLGIDRSLVHGFLLLQIGMSSWALGSIFQRRHSGKSHSIIAGGVQQLAAGIILLPFALAIPGHPVHWSVRGVAALLYLVMFGSIVGFSAYNYALDRLPVAVLSVYAYVNAAVAVALGWLFYREPFGPRQALAMVIIFAGVFLVKRYSRRAA